jgi:hypothetical protein
MAGVSARLFESLLWFGAILVAVMLGAVFALWARRHFRGAETLRRSELDLADLQRQRDEGRLSPAEYEAVRRVMMKNLKTRTHDGGE